MARGTVVWKVPYTDEYGGGGLGSDAGTPVISGGRVYASSASGRLVAYDESTGARVWSSATTDSAAQLTIPTVSGGILYARGTSTGEAGLYAFDAATGARRWKVTLGTAATGQGNTIPAVANGLVYAADDNGYVYA